MKMTLMDNDMMEWTFKVERSLRVNTNQALYMPLNPNPNPTVIAVTKVNTIFGQYQLDDIIIALL